MCSSSRRRWDRSDPSTYRTVRQRHMIHGNGAVIVDAEVGDLKPGAKGRAHGSTTREAEATALRRSSFRAVTGLHRRRSCDATAARSRPPLILATRAADPSWPSETSAASIAMPRRASSGPPA